MTYISSCVHVNSAGLTGHVSTFCRGPFALAWRAPGLISFPKSLRAELYPRSGHLLRLMREWPGNKIDISLFVICMVYGLQKVSPCYGGVDGDGSRASEIDGTSTEFKGRRFK